MQQTPFLPRSDAIHSKGITNMMMPSLGTCTVAGLISVWLLAMVQQELVDMFFLKSRVGRVSLLVGVADPWLMFCSI